MCIMHGTYLVDFATEFCFTLIMRMLRLLYEAHQTVCFFFFFFFISAFGRIEDLQWGVRKGVRISDGVDFMWTCIVFVFYNVWWIMRINMNGSTLFFCFFIFFSYILWLKVLHINFFFFFFFFFSDSPNMCERQPVHFFSFWKGIRN
jgi:hypothetical protein